MGTSLLSKLKVKTVCKIIFFKKIKVRNFYKIYGTERKKKEFFFSIIIQSICDYIEGVLLYKYSGPENSMIK